MIIGLSGYARSGKDEVAKILVEEHGFIRIAFADKIRELLYEMDPPVPTGAGNEKHVVGLQNYVDIYGWDEAKQNPIVRSMLQNLGVGARTVFHENFWVIEAFKNFDTQDKDYVVTDVRFVNEAETIERLGGDVWRVVRPGVEAVNSHVSERELDEFNFKTVVTNSGTLDDLKDLVRQEMGS